MARKTPQKAEDAPKQRALALLERAQDGDAAAMAEVRAILDANPSAWNELGDLARATGARSSNSSAATISRSERA